MIDRIISFSIKNKFIIGVLVIALIGWGIISATKIPLDAVPDITTNQVQIITLTSTLATQEVEQFITAPVEIAMANIPDVVEIRSISRFGISVITVVFEDDVDIYHARQLIAEQLKVAKEKIPENFGEPEMAPITTGLGEVYQYVLHTLPGYDAVYSDMDLRTINDWIVIRQLAGTPGVIDVSGWGGHLKQYEVAINPEKLRSMNLSLTEVFDAVEKNNENTGGSYIEKRFNTYFIRGEGLVKSLEDIEKIVVKTFNDKPVLIRDVATVQFGSAPRYGAMTWNGKGEVVGGQALMLKGENSYQVVSAIKKRIETIKKSLPEGVEIEAFIDRSELIDRTIRTVTTNLIEGGLIVIFILVLMLGNFRGGLVVASVIPLSMLFALGMMNLFGVSANLMSLGAIDFGLIVDGAVIIVESIVHRLHTVYHGNTLSQNEMDENVYQSASRIRTSAAFGEIIILIVYLPILALVGIEGKMFKPMAQTVSFAILGAFLLSLTYVPMMSAFFLSKKISSGENVADKIMKRLQKWYSPALNFSLNNKLAVIAISLLLFGCSLFVFNRLGGEFIPTLEEGDFALHQILPPGSSLAQSVEVSAKIQNILKEKFPEVETVVTKIGTSEIPTDPMPIEVGDIMVKLKDKQEWTSASGREEMFEKMEKELAIIPGVSYEFTQPIQMRFNELIAGVREDIAIKIYGEDLDALYTKAKQAEQILKGINGIGDIKVEQITGLPQMIVTYNRNRMAQYGLNIKDINQLIRTAFAGEKAGVVFEGEKRFDLVVRFDKNYRQQIQDIENLYVTLHDSSQIPLRELAKVEFKSGPMQISREDTKRRITIGINARGRDVESLVNEISSVLDEKLYLPPGYYIEYGGQFENLVEAKARLAIAVPVALLLILLLLFFSFKSVTQALLIFTAIPLSAIGGVFALWLRGMSFSISAGVGFIALFGVAVLNGIVLIAYFNQLKQEGMTDLKQRITEGTRVRLRPVVMTAAVAALGFLPMAISKTAGAEVQRPLATVVIGGLITATLLTLVLLPVLYSIVEKLSAKRMQGGATAVLVLTFFSGTFCVQEGRAQPSNVLTMEQAVEMAIKNHPAAIGAKLEVKKQMQLKKSAVDFENTRLDYTRGELEGADIDYELEISQVFKFPTTYAFQSKMQQQKIVLSEYSRDITLAELQRNVRTAYIKVAFGYSRLSLFASLENIYSRFSTAAEKRYASGETNLLEKVAAQSKFHEISLLKKQAEADVKIYEQELRQWLNTTDTIIIADTALFKMSFQPDISALQNNQLLAYYRQSMILSEQHQKVEKSGMLPGLSAGYFNKQIEGTSGFQGFTVGVSAPLAFWTQHGKIQAAKTDMKIAQTEYERYTLSLRTLFNSEIQEYIKITAKVDYYEKQGLTLANQQIEFAEKSYRAGDIDYFEYISNLQQAMSIKTNYQDALMEYNQTIIELNFLSGNFKNDF